MRRPSIISLLLSLIAAAYAGASQPSRAQHGVALFDTRRGLLESPSPAAIRTKQGWKKAETGPVSGDPCLENDRLVVCLMKTTGAAELYYRIGEDLRRAASLCLRDARGETIRRATSFELVENTGEAIRVRGQFRTGRGEAISVEFLLASGRPTVEILPGDGVRAALVRHQSPYAIMPDFFSNDLVFEADTTEKGPLCPPGDNLFLLHLIEGGDALLMCSWSDKEQEIQVRPGQSGRGRTFTETEAGCRPGAKVWVSVIADHGIWRAEDSGNYTIYEDKKIDWKVPFEAAWRLDYRRAEEEFRGHTDSWWNICRGEDGGYRPANKFRSPLYFFTWISVSNQQTRGSWSYGLGGNIYPFYTAHDSAHLRIPKLRYSKVRYAGRIFIYPWLHADHTPAEAVLPIDVLRDTLGPEYEKMLDIHELKRSPPRSVYPATCGVTEEVKKIFEEHAEQEKRKRIAERLRLMNTFVSNHRVRIQEYLDWADRMASFYRDERDGAPALAALIDRMQALTTKIRSRFDAVKDRIKTPEYAAALSQKLIDLIDSRAEDKIEQCDQLGRQIRTIGGGQDGTLASFRDHVRTLRQEAGLIAAAGPDPAARAFARRVRARTQEILRIRFGMEGK